jgi:hypothetical protein
MISSSTLCRPRCKQDPHDQLSPANNKPAQPLVKPRVEPDEMMKSKAPLRTRMRTYPLALSLWTKPIDLWTLGGIANSLQDRGLPCICPSDNEDSEPEIFGDFGEDLLCIYSTSPRRLALDLTHALITVLSREGRLAWGPEHACCWSVAGPQGGTLDRIARRLDRSLDRISPVWLLSHVIGVGQTSPRSSRRCGHALYG